MLGISKYGYSPIYFTKTNPAFYGIVCESAIPIFFTQSDRMINLNTTIESLGRAPTVRIANMALRWCRTHLGVNNRKKYAPVWSIRKGWDGDTCGEYDADDNEVFIYWDSIDDIDELLRTCIHEWTHQLQPITTKYFKYPGSYSRNPYERQARYAEKKWLPILWEHINNKVNNKK